MAGDPVTILGVRIDNVGWQEMLDEMERAVTRPTAEPYRIATVNVEYLMAARRDPEFATCLHQANLHVPDSVGVLWAARWLGHPLRERVTGSDGIYRIAERCAQRGFRLFLFGARPGVAARVAEILTTRCPGLIVCGIHPGLDHAGQIDDPANQEVVERIRQAHTDVLLVAYPQIAQEKWLSRHLVRSGAAVAMGVGAAFDFVAGTQKRAPRAWQRLGLEWLYRLLQEPWRWRRMLVLPQAAWLVFWQRFL